MLDESYAQNMHINDLTSFLTKQAKKETKKNKIKYVYTLEKASKRVVKYRLQSNDLDRFLVVFSSKKVSSVENNMQ